jgi:peroxiredoxin
VSNWVNRSLCGSTIAAAILLSACSSSLKEMLRPESSGPVRTAVKDEKDRKAAPDFTLKDSNGAQVKLSEYRGKVVLLNFWATWCGPCKIEIPWFMDFEQKYKDQGFAVLGVSMDEDGWEAVKPYIASKKINYRVMVGDDTVGNLYGGIESLPSTFVIDRDGKVASVHIGLVGRKDYETEIERLIESRTQAMLSQGAK